MLDHLPSILIVDDSATTRTMIKRVIEMTQLKVRNIYEASDGAEALEIMHSKHADFVLADLSMPVMGGHEMILRMRKDESLCCVPVVVISAQPDDEQIERLRELGVLGYLSKPFTPEGIRDLIGPFLRPQRCEADHESHSSVALQIALAEAFGDALETMAFITPDLADEPCLTLPIPGLRLVQVVFHGAGVTGEMTLATPVEFGALVSRNCGNSGSINEAEDALKELANVTCGLILRNREGGAKGFVLSPPTIETADDGKGLFSGDDSVVLNADRYQVAARIQVDRPLFKHEMSAAEQH